jgi:hypothetical protein
MIEIPELGGELLEDRRDLDQAARHFLEVLEESRFFRQDEFHD